jgi:transcriptional regulator with XRE-family HTH domain
MSSEGVRKELGKLGFGERLKRARAEAGLSGTELGVGLGEMAGKDASRQTISDWEKERHFPSVRQLYLICLKLGKSADELLFGHKDPFTDEKMATAAKAVGQLNMQQRADLLEMLSQPGIPDHQVERQMPATKKLKRQAA